MKRGDLLLVKPGSHVPPNGRYSQGIILENPDTLGLLTIAWHDGKATREYISSVSQYYTIIPNENS